jgi:hypothetical protein
LAAANLTDLANIQQLAPQTTALPNGGFGQRQLLFGFGGHGLMIVADILDLSV